LTRNANDTEPKKRTVTHTPTTIAQTQQPVDEDDVPAISKRTSTEAPASTAPSSTPRSSPMSIQEYLQNQQRK
jgi:cell division protein FtsZ